MMEPWSVLVVDDMHQSIVPLLEDMGLRVSYQPFITAADVLLQVPYYEGIVVRSKLKLDSNFFALARKLRFVARAGAGVDNIDLVAAIAHKVAVCHAAEGNRDAVAEHTMGLALALTNKIVQGHNQVVKGEWNRMANRGTEISEKVFALIGYGNMGQAVAKRLQGFGCQVIAYDKYLTDWPDTNSVPATLEQVFAYADFVSLHIPLTPETRGMANANFFAQFAKPVCFLNTARGEIVPLPDLLYAIKSGRVVAAGLDVLENERFDEHLKIDKVLYQALAATQKVIFTPHVAGWTVESYEKINHVLAGKIKRFLTLGT